MVGNSQEKFCKRCQAKFECRSDQIEECHCKKIKLTDETLKVISKLYDDCLCGKCLFEIQEEIQTKQL